MKNLFNNNIFSKEEQEIAKDLLNTINLKSGKNEISPFLSQLEQKLLEKIINYSYSNIKLDFFGGTLDNERKRAKLLINNNYDIDYNIVCLVANFNTKFHKIGHRDVLGAVHNLGLNFNRIGDIIVEDDKIFIFVDAGIAEYLIMNFSKIGRAVLNFSIEEKLADIKIEKKYQSLSIVCSSHRLDSIVSKIINKSRSKTKEVLQKEFVKVNHTLVTDGEKNCKIGDMISIRKYGRYILKESSQNTKSLKYRIILDKLV
ncbi:YlmH/Sll1252 family protein [Gemella sp. zg-1178]|uniref:YlmH/Sll1252 family protein n=1 Tax=Gemella sp. zg-1178 TaxID=2840372 RepID=UPI001C04ECCF|nr:YlmH/Sll1252 family protein [Gemella sp. zg-1178]MBU0278465.1 RNA-binding protein [Gemella sp. zg-1178]